MKLKTVRGEGRFFFITEEILESFLDYGVHLYSLCCSILNGDVPEKVMPKEYAMFLKVQDVIGRELGLNNSKSFLPILDQSTLREMTSEEKIFTSKVQLTFNELSSEGKDKPIYDGLCKFISKAKGFKLKALPNNVYLIVIGNSNIQTPPDFIDLNEGTLSEALLESIYLKLGYLDSHFGELPKVDYSSGEFGLADVFTYLRNQTHYLNK